MRNVMRASRILLQSRVLELPLAGAKLSVTSAIDGNQFVKSSTGLTDVVSGPIDMKRGFSAGALDGTDSVKAPHLKLIDASIDLLEKKKPKAASSVLKTLRDCLSALEPKSDSPVLGELHSQVALLSLSQGDAQGALTHAQLAQQLSKQNQAAGAQDKHALRLGVTYFAMDRMQEAEGMLRSVLESLKARDDPAQHEARVYLCLVSLAGAKTSNQVSPLRKELLDAFRHLAQAFGAESPVVSLALSQHHRVAHLPFSAAEPDHVMCETMLKQHARVLEEIRPNSEDLALIRYKLGTFYYEEEMMLDAENYVRVACEGLERFHPEDSDLVMLCKHRLGMVYAANGSASAAVQLLQMSHKYFEMEIASNVYAHALVLEAEVGMAFAKTREYLTHPGGESDDAIRSALDEVKASTEKLEKIVGPGHVITRGAKRHMFELMGQARRWQWV